MHDSLGGLVLLLLSAALVTAAPKRVLSVGPEDADTSFHLDSRGGIETFQGALPNEELLARHEILKESFDQKAIVAMKANFEGIESSVNPGSEYQVAYEVHAPSTGDEKSFLENRHEDGTVTGEYTVMNPDGTRRVVTYIATPEEGFKVIVGNKIDDDFQPPVPVADFQAPVPAVDFQAPITAVEQVLAIEEQIPTVEPVLIIEDPVIPIVEPVLVLDETVIPTVEPELSIEEPVIPLDEPEIPIEEPIISPNRLGYYDDSYEPRINRNLNLGLEENTSYYGGFRSGFSRPTFNEQQLRNDGQFGAKLSSKKQLHVSQYQKQLSKPQFEAHINPQNGLSGQYAAHIQDQTVLKPSDFTAQITNTVQPHQPLFHLIPVSIHKFSLDDMLGKYNVNKNFNWLERRKVPFTVVPAIIKKYKKL